MAWRDDRIRLEIYLTRELAAALDVARGDTPRATFVQRLIRKLRAKDAIVCACGNTTISVSQMEKNASPGVKITCGACEEVVWPRK